MKFKLFGFTVALVLVVLAFVVVNIRPEAHHRVHQHLETLPKGACTHSNTTFCTQLPLVSIDTGGALPTIIRHDNMVLGEGKRTRVDSTSVFGSIQVFDSAETNNHLTDQPAYQGHAQVKYRGNSSLYFDKKSFKVDLVNEDATQEMEYNLMGMGKDDNWVLNGPFLDKTLMRNYLCLNVAGEMMRDAPDVRFCEVFVNGQYQGVYAAMESISHGAERVDVATYQPGDVRTGYIIRFDRDVGQPEKLDLFSNHARIISPMTAGEMDYPGLEVISEQAWEYIEQDFNRFEKALHSFDHNDPKYGYPSFVDVDSFVDYYIINEFFMNTDAGLFSTNFYRDLGGKIHIGPVWDFNNACDNYIDIEPNRTYDIEKGTGFAMVDRPRYLMLFRDPAFVKLVMARYQELRQTVLKEEYLLGYIDDTRAFLGDAVERNYEVWGYSFNLEHVVEDIELKPRERNPKDYEAAMTQLKQFIKMRGDWMDKNIDLLQRFCHESRNKKFNH